MSQCRPKSLLTQGTRKCVPSLTFKAKMKGP